MTDDEQPTDALESSGGASPWAAPPSQKAKNGVKRAVDQLLDALAPERIITRIPRLPGPIERHRTPRACVLQAATAAVSVTWFPDAATDLTLGELQVTAWQGIVSRPGSAHRAVDGASVASAATLVPVDAGPDGWQWRAVDGTMYDTDALVAYCAALLERLMAAADHGGT